MRTNRFLDLFLTFLCFTLALFSKETAALIPFLFLFYFIYTEGGGEIRSMASLQSKIGYKHFLLAGLMLCTGIIWFYLRYHAVVHQDKIIFLKDFIYNLQNIPTTLSQIVIPYEMSPFPRFTYTKIILGSLIFIGLVFIFIKKTATSRWEKLFFLLWFFLFLFPPFFSRAAYVDYLEHRYLLPQIGIIGLIVKIFTASDSLHATRYTLRVKKILYFSFFFLIFIFCVTSFIKARTLQNPVTVVDAVEKYRGIIVHPYTNRGVYYFDQEMYKAATDDFYKTLQLDPLNIVAANNLALIHVMYEEYEGAIAFYTYALSIDNKTNAEKLYSDRSVAKIQTGDFEGALLDADSAIMLKKNSAILYNNRGGLRMHFGLTEEALADYDEAVRLSNFTYGSALRNRAFVKLQLEDITGALQDCNKALQLEPTNEEFLALKDTIRSKVIRM
jgi:tetratricopeptide (TPR) repeat protein